MAQIIDNPEAYVCTPKSLLASSPCLQCVSESDLVAALVGILASAADKTVAEVLEDSACFKCLSEKEMLQALVTVLGNQFIGDREGGVAEVVEDYKCLRCVPKHTLYAAIIYLICTFDQLTIEPLPT